MLSMSDYANLSETNDRLLYFISYEIAMLIFVVWHISKYGARSDDRFFLQILCRIRYKNKLFKD